MNIPEIITIKKAVKLLKQQTGQDFLMEIKVAVQNDKITAAHGLPCFSFASIDHFTGETSSFTSKPNIEHIEKNTGIYTESLNKYLLEKYDLSIEYSNYQQPVPENLTKNSDINQKEKRSYLLLIAALCKANKIDLNERGAAKRLEELTDSGLSVGYKTILKIVDEINSFDLPKV